MSAREPVRADAAPRATCAAAGFVAALSAVIVLSPSGIACLLGMALLVASVTAVRTALVGWGHRAPECEGRCTDNRRVSCVS